ncbi:hypothetical protein PHLGIDRAFT_339678 [Phlebiopsis gigantea 11061_1 CR5-6]|uniref:F-box domain-containing protein n=1 Tax=Phlebiopsis gigantea (strain 11061_1 CR5-6) TaxID=745531 RepID=A0A0C3NVC7_PHLG1|nr:hypothetical protein PHLGIDRAFT_339678 [Phlebiopsis gigantea 11061_1 CR5-6]
MARQEAAARHLSIPTTKAKAVGRSRGRAAAAKSLQRKVLADVPVDVFYEMAAHLHPLDLLHLARTTKTFRRVLMRRGARSIWQTVIQNVTDRPLPEMPGDMSEPAWIDLLFVHTCHNCWKKGSFAAFWEIRMRLCPACRKGLECKLPFGAESKSCLRKHFPECQFGEEIVSGYSIHYLMPVLVKQVHAHRRKLDNGSYPYRQSDYDELKNELVGASSVAERMEIVHKREAMMKERRGYAFRCLLWESDQKEARSQSRQQTLAARRRAIVTKLRELGWGPELDEMDFAERNAFVKLPAVARDTPLTDRIWESIKDECIEHMESVKTAHDEDTGGLGDPGIEDWDGVDPKHPEQDYWDQYYSPQDFVKDLAEFMRGGPV